jgi:uncharacterized protein (DUF58 family)
MSALGASTSSAAGAGRRGFIDPRALMRIGSLELRARVVVEGFWNGLHRSPFHGFSAEFTEYRPYSAGDDPRYVDWRVLARSDRVYIKKFEDETNLRCHLLVDRSRSMDYGSAGVTKADYASTLAATLAQFLQRQGDAVGLMTFDERVREYLPARARSNHLRQLLLALDRPIEGRATDLVAPLEHILTLVRKRGLLVLVSDFLAPLDQLEASLTTLAICGHELLVFHLVDPAEASLSYTSPLLFEDLETERTLFVDPEVARAGYRARFTAHLEAVRRSCERQGVAHHLLSTDEPLELALFAFLKTRQHRAKSVRGARPAGGGQA